MAQTISATYDGKAFYPDFAPALPPNTKVQIIVEKILDEKSNAKKYSLRGEPITFVEPTEPVANNDWNVLQ